MALNCRDGEQMSRQLSGVKRTRHGTSRAAVIDPEQTPQLAEGPPLSLSSLLLPLSRSAVMTRVEILVTLR